MRTSNAIETGKEQMPSISIIIAAYNEEKNVEQTLKELIFIFDKKKEKYGNYEIILVDDGSTDKTSEEANSISKKYPQVKVISSMPNKGKGFAIRKGMNEAKGDIFLLTDADLAYALDDIDTFLDSCSLYDVAVGTRMHPQSTYLVNYKSFKLIFLRHAISRVFNAIVDIFLGIKQKDKQCGLKVMKKELGKYIASHGKINGFSYDVELFLIAKNRGNKIIELPVQVKYSDTDSKVRVWKHAPKMFLELLTIRYNQLKGVYDRK